MANHLLRERTEIEIQTSEPPRPPGAVSKAAKALLGSSLRRPLTVLVLMVMDGLALLIGLALAGYLVKGEGRVGEVIYLAPVLTVTWLAILSAQDLYGQAQSRRNPGALLGAILWFTVLLSIGSTVYPQSGFSAPEIAFGVLFVALLSIGLRLLYERGIEFIYRLGLGRIPTLIVGGDEQRARVRRVMEKDSGAYACVGELDVGDGGVVLPSLRRALDRTEARNVILVGAEQLSDVQFLDLLRSMWLRKVKVEVVPGVSTLAGSKPTISQDIGIPLLEVGYPRLDSVQWALKRMLDIVGSVAGIVALSPLLVGTAVLIKLTSPGPVFFRQKRAGADEKVFLCYKFRSMYQDADRRQAALEAQNESGGAIFKIKNDPRVTPIGRFIRRWSIDELPQLINVLKGEMSLVGPRPLPLRDFELMSEMHKKRLATIPGLTGYWQISGRSNLSFEDMVRLDLHYIENWSLSMDIKIIVKTFGAVSRCDGAY